ncbi:MAG: PEP-utilizing enzyme [Chloroflexota bacterium]|nr:PEP-utilizing enzyme [Chloroflexota bacterium]
MHVAWLGEPASFDAATVGGKTANLGRLATSFRVPPGFCLDVSAFDQLRHALDGDAVARGQLRELVSASYADLARRVGEPEPRVAVRSSAIGEDSGDASFAGQHETVLDVGGVDAIVDALLECWRSVYSERAAAYRTQRGITGAPRIAVLVQLMVPADASAIAFSADPVSGARDVVVVNAARGLGDAIASGTITPDSYTVRKRDLAIIARACADGGSVPDDDIAAIAGLAMQLETVMGGPVDIECALRGGELHLLQCRPITTLAEEFPVTWDDPDDAKLTWEREDAHFDRVFAPLSGEFITNGPDYGIRKRLVAIGFPLLVRHRAFNGRFYASEKPLVAEDRLPEELTRALTFRRAFARTLRHQWDEELLPELHEQYAWMRRLAPAQMAGDDAAEAWLDMWRRVQRVWTIHFIVTGSAYPVMEELAQAYEELVGGNGAEALAITQGRAPTLQRLEADLHGLSEATRRWSRIAAALADGERSVVKLVGLEGGAEFARALESFLGVHGDIGQENFDLESAGWRDDPSKLLAVIAQRLRSVGEHPDARAARVRARASETLARARERLGERPDDRARFEEVLAAATSAGPLTEEHNYWIDRVSQAHVRRLCLAFGERLVADGALGSADEIFLLYVPEIANALRKPELLVPLVARRRRDLSRWRRLASPKTIGAPPSGPEVITPGVALERVSFEYTVAQDDPYRLKGVAASAGLARGPARLITGDEDFSKMRAGDVLVCRQSTVSWAPLFTLSAAVVTEIGGSLCHAAVVAREFGVPCVVATGGVLSTLTDGEPLEVDGSKGTVRRLFPIVWEDPDDANLVWRRDDAHQTSVRTPLGIDYTLHGAAYGMRKRDLELGPPVLARVRAFNGRMYNSAKPLRPPEEMPEHQQNAIGRRRRLGRRIRKDWDERYLPELNEIYAWMSALEPAAIGRDEAVTAWDELWRRHKRAWTIHMLITAAAYTVTDELGQTYEELVGGPALDAFAMTQGLAPALQQLDKDLFELTAAAGRSRSVTDAILRGAALEELRRLDPSFGRAVEAFLAVHGDNGQSSEGLGTLAWSDDPSLLIGAIGARLGRATEHPNARLARLRRDAEETARRAREHLAGRAEELARFEEVLAAATSAGPLTEEHNYWLDRRNQARMGREVRRFGMRLVRDGALRDVEEIFLLYVPEVREALRAPTDLSALIVEREGEVRRWKAMEPPETIGAQAPPWQRASSTRMIGQSFLLYREQQADTSRMLRGVGASAGIARGPARLIRELTEFAKFKSGDVLVCQASNVSWIPLFVSAAAVITEVGGALSHAAVVAREFGVPAVVGTGVALSTLVDGELLEVDGGAGIVRRLSA